MWRKPKCWKFGVGIYVVTSLFSKGSTLESKFALNILIKNNNIKAFKNMRCFTGSTIVFQVIERRISIHAFFVIAFR